MEFRILGRLEVLDDGRHVRLGGAADRALLAILLLHANEVVSIERIVLELWEDEPPPTAQGIVYNRVSRLRKVLGGDRIVSTGGGYLLRVGLGELDRDRFFDLVREANSLPPDRRAAALRAALALWRDVPLPEFVYASFCRRELEALDDTRLAAVEARIEAELELGQHEELLNELEVLVARHPLRERLRIAFMLALYRSGRRSDALGEYARMRQDLLAEVGVAPSAALRSLHAAMLRQDPELAPSSRGTPLHMVERVVTILPTDERERGQTLYRLALGLMWIGESERARSLCDEALRHARAVGDRALEARISVELTTQAAFHGRKTLPDAVASFTEAIAILEEEGDHEGLAATFHRLSGLERDTGNAARALETAERALWHAGKSSNKWYESIIAGGIALALARGSVPVTVALRRCHALPSAYRDTFGYAAGVALLYAEAGQFEVARGAYSSGKAHFEKQGMLQHLGSFVYFGGRVERLAGDLEAAERELTEGLALLKALALEALAATVWSELAVALAAAGRADEAVAAAEAAGEAVTDDETPVNRAEWRLATALALNAAGRGEEAEEAARDAVELAGRTDSFTLRGDADLALARVLAARRCVREAVSRADLARRLYERKENITGVADASRFLDSVQLLARDA